MSRLTCKYDVDNVLRDMCTFDRESNVEADDCLTCFEYCNNKDMNCEKCDIQKAFDKLAEYEDLEEQGLLLKLPCKLGDETYWISDEDNEGNKGLCVRGKSYVEGIAIDKDGFLISTGDGSWDRPNKSRWCFLTKEEAEKALERLEKENVKRD